MPTDPASNMRVDFRATETLIAKLDDWRRRQPDLPTRTEALRRLVTLALDADPPAKPARRQGGARP